ncbi:hypothetical protein KIW84_035087 [Lathyrus oleraceus]|uniref:C2H2-type domain-containing protein n=1 Tax=Pisum sativum TaxID=3888 RepID=A0A9D4Y4P5_PEA|nr:hypothetical protein KIW84_035087 [Pisum sativum]
MDNSSSNQVDHPENNNKANPFLQNSALNTQLPRPLDPRPMISEAWKTLRLSLLNFHGVPVGTIAALDSSDEKLNFDQIEGGDDSVLPKTIPVCNDRHSKVDEIKCLLCSWLCPSKTKLFFHKSGVHTGHGYGGQSPALCRREPSIRSLQPSSNDDPAIICHALACRWLDLTAMAPHAELQPLNPIPSRTLTKPQVAFIIAALTCKHQVNHTLR